MHHPGLVRHFSWRVTAILSKPAQLGRELNQKAHVATGASTTAGAQGPPRLQGVCCLSFLTLTAVEGLAHILLDPHFKNKKVPKKFTVGLRSLMQ